MAIDRQQVYDKYGGKCAYCGCKLDKFQVDHIFPQRLSHQLNSERYRDKHDIEIANIDHIDNLNPSCYQCNNFKTGMSIHEMRRELSKQVDRIKSTQFNRALKYGQVNITRSPIWFYFEKVDLGEWFKL